MNEKLSELLTNFGVFKADFCLFVCDKATESQLLVRLNFRNKCNLQNKSLH